MRCKMSILCLMCVLSLILAQELAAFDEDSTIDFEKDDILADLESSVHKHTTDYHPKTKDVNTLTDSTPHFVNHISDSHTTATLRTAFRGRKTTSTHKEDEEGEEVEEWEEEINPRFARIRDVEETEKEESMTATADNEAFTTTETSKRSVEKDMSKLQDLYGDLLVETPPNIRWPLSQQRVIVLEQHRKGFSITCQADGHPVPIYKWLKDDQLLDGTQNFISAFENGTLVFTEFSARENGLYQCLAISRHGTSVSVKVPIVSERPPGYLAGEVNVNKTREGNEGEPMSFECADTPPTVPEYIKRWYFLTGTTQLQITNRTGTDSKGVLRFAYLEPSDATVYICALTPEVAVAGDSIRLYNTATLRVYSKEKVPSKPKLAYASTAVKATLGQSATLECFFSGYPIPEITWKNSSNHVIKKGDKKFIISEQDFGRKLIVADVQEENAGNFTCSASNGYGGDVYATISFNVTAPPQKIPHEGLNTLTVPEGQDVVLKCKAKAVGRQLLDTPMWYRNNRPITESNLPFSMRYSFRSNRTELHIHDPNKNVDTACFQCNISNSEGYLFYDGYLRVINSIQIEKRPKEYNVISRNSTIDISIKANGDACCKIDKRWHLNGIPLTQEELQQNPFVWKDGDILMFDASTVDNDTLNSKVGNYTCRVSNKYQFVEVHFIISLNNTGSSAELQIAKEGRIEMWWIGLICGILLIALAAAIIVIVIKSNYPRDSYPLEKAEIKHHLDPEKDLLDQSFQEI